MAILLFVHLTRHSSTAIEQLSCISLVPESLGGGPPMKEYFLVAIAHRDEAVAKFSSLLP